MTGDFNEKYTTTPPSCFTTSDNADNTVTIMGYDAICETDVIIPNALPIVISQYVLHTDETENLNKCVTYFDGQFFPPNESAETFCLGGNRLGMSFITWLDHMFNSTDIEYFLSNGIISQTSSVSINKYPVTIIGDWAFHHRELTSVVIPNSVTTIGDSAFAYNQLTSVTIGNGITSIGYNAFEKSNDTSIYNGVTYYSNLNLSSITIDKLCNDIKNNLLSNATNYYPWLSYNSPYIAYGVTIYGSGNQVCDNFEEESIIDN